MATAFEKIVNDRKKIVEDLIEKMKEGYNFTNPEWNRFWVRPQNPVSEVYYKGINRLKLGFVAATKGYEDPRWLTYAQAKSKGWYVKSGEHGIICEKWILTKKEKQIDPETKEEREVEVKLPRPIVNYFVVFNAQQIEGIPTLELPKLEKGQILETAEKFIKSSECKIRELGQERAYYNVARDEIVLPLRNAFKSEEAFLATTLHEMVHSTGHPDRLNREMGTGFGSKEYAREELIAEVGTVFLKSNLNIKLEGEHFQDHSNYLKSWIEVLKSDYNELFRAAKFAEIAAERLYSRYLEIEKAQIQDTNINKIDPLDNLIVKVIYSEYNFNIPEDTYLKGAAAYEFLKEAIKVDREINKQNKLNNDLDYNKLKIDFYYKNFSRENMRIDLGDLEFKKALKVSTAIENRLMLHIDELKNPSMKSFLMEEHKLSSDEYDAELKKMVKDIKAMTKDFKIAEKEYLTEQEHNKASKWAKKEKTQEIEW